MRYSVAHLANGLVHIRDRASGLSGVYGYDGFYVSGDLRLSVSDAAGVIGG